MILGGYVSAQKKFFRFFGLFGIVLLVFHSSYICKPFSEFVRAFCKTRVDLRRFFLVLHLGSKKSLRNCIYEDPHD